MDINDIIETISLFGAITAYLALLTLAFDQYMNYSYVNRPKFIRYLGGALGGVSAAFFVAVFVLTIFG